MPEVRCPALESAHRVSYPGAGFRCICGKMMLTDAAGRIPEHTVDAETVRITDQERGLLQSTCRAVLLSVAGGTWQNSTLLKSWAARLLVNLRPLTPGSLLRDVFRRAEKAHHEEVAAFTALVGDAEAMDKRAICEAFIAGKLFQE